MKLVAIRACPTPLPSRWTTFQLNLQKLGHQTYCGAANASIYMLVFLLTLTVNLTNSGSVVRYSVEQLFFSCGRHLARKKLAPLWRKRTIITHVFPPLHVCTKRISKLDTLCKIFCSNSSLWSRDRTDTNMLMKSSCCVMRRWHMMWRLTDAGSFFRIKNLQFSRYHTDEHNAQRSNCDLMRGCQLQGEMAIKLCAQLEHSPMIPPMYQTHGECDGFELSRSSSSGRFKHTTHHMPWDSFPCVMHIK